MMRGFDGFDAVLGALAGAGRLATADGDVVERCDGTLRGIGRRDGNNGDVDAGAGRVFARGI